MDLNPAARRQLDSRLEQATLDVASSVTPAAAYYRKPSGNKRCISGSEFRCDLSSTVV